MKRLYEWKAWIIPAIILLLGIMFWPAQGGPSTKLNPTDRTSENIDYATRLEDAVHASGDTGVMSLAVRNDTLAALAGTDGDYGPLQVNAAGAVYTADVNSAAMTTDLAAIEVINTAIKVATEGAEDELDGTTTSGPLAKMIYADKTLLYAQINTALSGADVQLVAVDGSKLVYVVELLLTVDAQCQIAFTDGSETAGAVAPQFFLAQRGSVHLPRLQSGYHFSGDASEALAIDAIAGTPNVSGYIWYYQE